MEIMETIKARLDNAATVDNDNFIEFVEFINNYLPMMKILPGRTSYQMANDNKPM